MGYKRISRPKEQIEYHDPMYKRLQELEDKIENGTLIELPCKVGDTVYCLLAQGVWGTLYTTGKPIAREVNKIIFNGQNFEVYSARVSEAPNDCCF